MTKIPVAILGATGVVGQKFVELLTLHPWFEIVAVTASDKSVGKRYKEVSNWRMVTSLDPKIAEYIVLPTKPDLPCKLVFSALDSSVAKEIEEEFAKRGYIVVSNASSHRMREDVPLLIPEVNPEHLELLTTQHYSNGSIITNPNCNVVGICMALKPLATFFGIEKVHVTTMQAISGAGYPGVASYDILDNLIPFIAGEEEKVEKEPLKILGEYRKGAITPYPVSMSAGSARVPVTDGHMAFISLQLDVKTTKEEILRSWQEFKGIDLPSAPKEPLVYFEEDRFPQPKLHRNLNQGMSVAIGRLRKCNLFDWKFVVLSHNTVRGAAGCAILNAELMVKKGYVPHGDFCDSNARGEAFAL